MLLASEVRRGWVKDPRKVRMEDFKLQFTPVNQQATKSTNSGISPSEAQRKATTELAKARWLGMMGRPLSETTPETVDTTTLNSGTGPIEPN